MCIAIYKPLGETLTDETLKNCWQNNPDGAGFMYADKGKVIVEKGFMTYEAFRSAYDTLLPTIRSDMAIHFRISTGGKIDTTNCHPHQVDDGLAFIHNGILFTPEKESLFSDTAIFCRDVLQQLPANFLHNAGQRWLIENAIGSSNKMVFLDGHGKATILHETHGEWDKGIWYSNTSYKWQYRAAKNYTWPDDEYTGMYGKCYYDKDTGKEGTEQKLLEGGKSTDNHAGNPGVVDTSPDMHDIPEEPFTKYNRRCVICHARLSKELRRMQSDFCWKCIDDETFPSWQKDSKGGQHADH